METGRQLARGQRLHEEERRGRTEVILQLAQHGLLQQLDPLVDGRVAAETEAVCGLQQNLRQLEWVSLFLKHRGKKHPFETALYMHAHLLSHSTRAHLLS